MAKYYFCNGTRKNNLPCSKPVDKECCKCHFHGGSGGSRRFARIMFESAKSAVDAIVYTHAAVEAYPFVIKSAKNILEVLSHIGNFQLRLRIHEGDFIDQLVDESRRLSKHMTANEDVYLEAIGFLSEDDTEMISCGCTQLQSLLNAEAEESGGAPMAFA